MTNRERVIASLNFQKTDRLCFSPLCDGYFTAGLPAQGHKNDLIPALKYIGCDIILRHTPCYTEHYRDMEFKHSEANGVYTTEYITPKGNISTVFYFKNGTMFRSKYFIEKEEDLAVMEYVAAHTYFKPAFDEFKKYDDMVGDAGIAVATAPMSPMLEVLQTLCGLQNTTFMLMDCEEGMKSLFSAIHERNKQIYELLTRLPSDFIFAYEDTSTTLLSRDWMSGFAVPALNDYADILHKGGKKYITHMCGKLTGFSCEIAGVRSDGIDSVCPPTTGDMTLAEARKAFPDKALIGGIEPPSMVLKSKADVLYGVIDTLNALESKSGIILSSGDAVPYGTKIELLRSISDMIKDLGERSLKPAIPKSAADKFI